jgi:hypothetical protein
MSTALFRHSIQMSEGCALLFCFLGKFRFRISPGQIEMHFPDCLGKFTHQSPRHSKIRPVMLSALLSKRHTRYCSMAGKVSLIL